MNTVLTLLFQIVISLNHDSAALSLLPSGLSTYTCTDTSTCRSYLFINKTESGVNITISGCAVNRAGKKIFYKSQMAKASFIDELMVFEVRKPLFSFSDLTSVAIDSEYQQMVDKNDLPFTESYGARYLCTVYHDAILVRKVYFISDSHAQILNFIRVKNDSQVSGGR